jgi:hypothetical protein
MPDILNKLQWVAEQAAKETKGGTGAYNPVVDIVEEAIKEILALRKEMWK